MHLQLQLRGPSSPSTRHQQHLNCFAKLHPRVVQKLYEEALLEFSKEPSRIEDVHNYWQVVNEDESEILFLPLKVTFTIGSDGTGEPQESIDNGTTEHVMYVSYNGGHTDQDCVIELPECLLGLHTLQQSQEEFLVSVQPIYMVKHASAVYLEPLTTNDWELIEMYAGQLEAGLLLSQVSIVYPTQTLSLQLGTDIVHLRVLENGFSMNCLHLVAESEVIIAPKPRETKKAADIGDETQFSISPPLRLLPSDAEFSTNMKAVLEVFNDCGSSVSKLLPCPPLLTGFMHPLTLSKRIDGWNEMCLECDKDPNSKFVYVSLWKSHTVGAFHERDSPRSCAFARIEPNKNIPLDCVVLHPGLRLQINSAPHLHLIHLQVLTHLEIERKLVRLTCEGNSCIIPLRLRDRKSQCRNIWYYPEDYCTTVSSSYIPFLGDSNTSTIVSSMQKYSPNFISDNRDSILSSGSIIHIVGDFSCLFKVVLDGGSSSPLLPAQDLPKLIEMSKGRKLETEEDMNIPDEYMMNLLPCSQPPMATIIKEVERCVALFCEGKDAVVLSGDRGSGKTYFALTLAAKLRMTNHFSSCYLDCRQLQSSTTKMDQLLCEITGLFHYSVTASNSLLILDNIDDLIPHVDESTGEEGSKPSDNPALSNQVKCISDHIIFLLNGSNTQSFKVVLTCQKKFSMNDELMQLNMATIDVPILTGIEKLKTLSCFIGQDFEHFSLCEHPDSEKLVTLSKGFSPLDLKCISFHIRKMAKLPLRDPCSSDNIMKEIIKKFSTFIPLRYQSMNIVKTEPELRWSQIGGLKKARLDLCESILQPIKYGRIFVSLPVSIPKGILLFGPPGCGKTVIVPALAKECGYNLITCRGPELFDKYIGQSEAKVRELFNAAYEASPSILFLDEFDSLAPRRGSDNTGVTDRVVNQLLTYLDGVEVHDACDVYIIAASSRPDKIDPALLRPGRLEKHIYLGFAQNFSEWVDLFTKIAMKRNLDDHLIQSIEDQTFFEHIEKSNVSLLNYSAADVKGIFDTAQLNAIHEYLCETTDAVKTGDQLFIAMNHLEDAFLSSSPSLPLSDRLLLAKAYLPFIGPDMSSDELNRSVGLDPTNELQFEPIHNQLTALK